MNDLNSVLLEGRVALVVDYTSDPEWPSTKIRIDVMRHGAVSQYVVFAYGRLASKALLLEVEDRVRIVGHLDEYPSTAHFYDIAPTCIIAEHIETRPNRSTPTEKPEAQDE